MALIVQLHDARLLDQHRQSHLGRLPGLLSNHRHPKLKSWWRRNGVVGRERERHDSPTSAAFDAIILTQAWMWLCF
jgi:hypothetical protein